MEKERRRGKLLLCYSVVGCDSLHAIAPEQYNLIVHGYDYKLFLIILERHWLTLISTSYTIILSVEINDALRTENLIMRTSH